MPRTVVLTGAPGSGKTTLGHAIVRANPDRIALIPEAATQVYSRIGKRWNELSIDDRRQAQREIFRLQVEQEDRIARDNPDKLILLDRGTLDGSAYWPGGPDAYWPAIGERRDEQLARYDRVIILESAASIGIYDGDASNPVRFESVAEIAQAQVMIEHVWAGHPDLHRAKAMSDLAIKRKIIEALLF